jgi:hypothetical protein
MSKGYSALKDDSRLGDPDDGLPEHFIPAYLILFDKKTKMYRAYHADIEDMIVLDEDPVNALDSLISILSMETNPNEDIKWN